MPEDRSAAARGVSVARVAGRGLTSRGQGESNAAGLAQREYTGWVKQRW
jgi:hypothetical protein